MKVGILSSGAGYHCQNFARLNGFDHIPPDQMEISNEYDVLWFIGFFETDAIRIHQMPQNFAKIVIQFIGSDTGMVVPDVRDLMVKKAKLSYPIDSMMRLAMIDDLKKHTVLTVAPHLSDELMTVGVESEVVPLISSQFKPLETLGDKILCFSNPRTSLFRLNLILDLAYEYQDEFSFVFYGQGEFSSGLKNIEHTGWIGDKEKERLYGYCNTYIRSCIHDGMPQSLIEAKQRGLNALWMYDHPYVGQFDFMNGDIETLANILRKNLKSNRPDFKGSKYFQKNYSVDRLKQQVSDVLNNL